MGKKGYLILESGAIFEGESFGYDREVSGEVVFNTGMTGYPESFTDPSYYGQILTMTYPSIGNYGLPKTNSQKIIKEQYESAKIQISALLVSTYVDSRTHWDASQTLSSRLIKEKIPALCDIDTRTLTKILREQGVAKGAITFQKPRDLSGFSFYDINKDNLVSSVSNKKISKYGSGKIRILFIDCGLKYNQIRLLLKYDTTIIRIPWDFNPFTRFQQPFDTVFISNGPGDARNMPPTINIVKQVLKRKIPVFGICLGHQILTLAAGGKIYKLKYGHRGQNQPVKDEFTNKCYITSQNHGFASITSSLSSDWSPWFTNLNDHTNEGIHHQSLPFFSVQYHPEAAPGPKDTEWLFDYYLSQVKKWYQKNQK